MVHAASRRDTDGDQQLVGSRRIRDPEGDGVVELAHEERVLVGEREIEGLTGGPDLGGRRDPGLGATDGRAEGVPEDGRQTRDDVLLLAGDAGDPAFAVPEDRSVEQPCGTPPELGRERRARVDEGREVRLIPPREGVRDHDGGDGLAERRVRGGSRVVMDLLDESEPLADDRLHERTSQGATGTDRSSVETSDLPASRLASTPGDTEGDGVGQDLRSALEQYDAAGELRRIEEPVDWRFEASAVLWHLNRGPAALMTNIPGYDVPLVGNVLNSRRKLAIALGLTADELQPRLVAALTDRRPPVVVEDAPCQEVVTTEGIDLLASFPVPWISEHDDGRYLSAGLIISRDPDDGRHNVAICRLAVAGPDRLGAYLAPTHTSGFLKRAAELGRPLEVAIVIGSHPAMMAASQFLTPHDELEVAGGILGEPLEVARCRTVDVLVPAGSEIVLEGTIDPTETAAEGPFGEFPGTYSERRDNPVVRLRAVTHRERPMLQMICGGRHPEHLITGAVAREATLFRAVRDVIPTTRRVVLPEGGNCRFHAVVSIRQRTPGEARLAMLAAFAAQDLLKHVTVVDHDVDIEDPNEVEWAVSTRMRADRDLIVIPGVKSNPVDPMSEGRTIAKLGIDATLPVTAEEDWPPIPGAPAAVRERIAGRLGELLQ